MPSGEAAAHRPSLGVNAQVEAAAPCSPLPSWGNMLTNSLNYFFKAPHLVVFPGLAVGLIVLCVYMLADGLRDAFDPRLKE